MPVPFALAVFAASALPPLLARVELFGRPLLDRYCAERGIVAAQSWCAGGASESVQQAFWRWLARADGRQHVFALPELDDREVQQLLEMAPAGDELSALPRDAPVRGLVLRRQQQQPAPTAFPTERAAANARMRAWVARTLTPSGLKFCPYTGSSDRAATGLEATGITEAPIAYAVADGSTVPQLMEAFWDACVAMLEAGEAGTSSIILAAPSWDDRWDEWCYRVFPCLEASLLASRRGRDLGIVCFHPFYAIPDELYLARHRFGHMRSTARLRSYVDEQRPQLSAATDDGALEWAAAYQRRSPHACINVLWARQLEVAETKRKSSVLYARNVGKALQAGREPLERAAAEERSASGG